MSIDLLDISNKEHIKQVEEIFFDTSSVKEFDSQEVKDEFKAKYLSHYIRHHSDYFFVAKRLDEVIGYLSCCPCTSGNEYFSQTFGYYKSLKNQTLVDYPAHFHINLSKKARGRGLGSKLVAHACDLLKSKSVPGAHVFTTPDNINVDFYRKNLFCDELTIGYRDKKLLFMGRKFL